MKRVFFIILSLLLVLFVAITLLKHRSSEVNSENSGVEKTITEKKKIQRFWEIYRQATEHRIAGNYQEAAEEYSRALRLNNRHEDTLYYLGNMYLELGEFREAEKAWKRLVQINPNSARAHFQLGILYLNFEQKEFFNIKSAEVEFKRALEINKEETGPLLRLGQIALIRGDLPEAQHYFNAVIGSNYRSVEAHFLNGYITWKTGNSRKALSLLEKAVKYSRPLEPVKGILSEGDTKQGRSSGMPNRYPIFQNHLRDLSELDESILPQQMDVRYQKLESLLNRIRKEDSPNR